MACENGDLPSVKAAVAAGASVNEGRVPGWGTILPLAAAVGRKHHDVVVWLLSHGADPNGDGVMNVGAYESTAVTLQLLIDAGGDVNRESLEMPPLCAAVIGNSSEGNERVLLAQPSLDFTIEYDGNSPEQWARDIYRPALAELIAQEVRGNGGFPFGLGKPLALTVCVCGVVVAGRS